MLTAAAVAQLLGISRRMVYDLAASGRLPSYRIGDALRFDPTEVETFKASCRSAGTPRESAGALNSSARMQVCGSALHAFFRKAGVKPRQTPLTEPKDSGSSQLRRVK